MIEKLYNEIKQEIINNFPLELSLENYYEVEDDELNSFEAHYNLFKKLTEKYDIFDFDNRNNFNKLIEEILNYKIERVIVTYKDRLTRIGFKFFENLFKSVGTEVIVINDYINEKSDSEELIEEIITLLHNFSMKFYSKRRSIKKCIENAIKDSK